jgi:hypothetical protein
MSEEATPHTYESQQDRWIKYGGNVALVSIIVVALACLVIWLFDLPRLKSRTDTTMSGLYSLKPQTVQIIKNNKTPVRIISLYTKPKPNPDAPVDAEPPQDFMGPVADLLQEYERKGAKIDVEIIDPVEQVAKVDQLINEVTEKYGGEVAKYKKFIADFMPPAEDAKANKSPPTTRPIYSELSEMATEEAKRVQETFKSGEVKLPDRRLAQSLIDGVTTVADLPRNLGAVKEKAERDLKKRPPDYKGVVDALESGLGDTSASLGALIENFERVKDDPQLTGTFKEYVVTSLPRYQALKKKADDVLARIKGLGELKLDQLRSNLREYNAILVMGPDDMRSLPFDKVWPNPVDVRGFVGGEQKPKRRFAGEQQVTSAILAVTSNVKPKVCFVRSGGPPLTTEGSPFQRGGPFSLIAERLREYNFQVMEKDLSGSWAMQAQMQRMPAAPEPSDEEIKDAVWVVIGVQSGGGMMGGPAPSVGPKLAAHLNAGGSALVLGAPNGDAMPDALEPWGVKIRTDAVIVHDVVKDTPRSRDFVEQAKKSPPIFVQNSYGKHVITNTLGGLDTAWVMAVPVETTNKSDRTVTRFLPLTNPMNVWGETKIETVESGETIAYNPPDAGKPGGDVPPPLFTGAASEKAGGGRVVVIGCLQFAVNNILTYPDMNLLEQGYVVSRFPGNAELFMNSVFWLARQEPMIAISPAAMETNRVKDVSPGAMIAWRSLLLAIVPLGVLAAGAMVYFARRD